jgi:integrase
MKNAVRVRGRNGAAYWYFRRGGKTIGRLPGEPGSPEWLAAYQKFQHNEAPSSGPGTEGPGSFGEAVALYLKSAAFAALSESSRRQYRNALERLRPKLGGVRLDAIRRKHIMALQDQFADRPGMANLLVGVLSGFFKWAIRREMIEASPTAGVESLAMGEHRPWPPQVIESVLKIASPEVALAVTLAVHTGQRRGDLVALRWDQAEGGVITMRQRKTGKELWIPIHQDLAAALESAPRVAVTMLADPAGRPWKPDALTAAVAAALRLAGYKGYTLHGLRKSAAVALAEAGCSAHEIQAITGHESLEMMEHYAKGASQKRLATAAIHRLETATTAKQCKT